MSPSKRTLAIDLGAGLVLPTPVIVAAGCAGTGRELPSMVDMKKIGAIVSRTVTARVEGGSPAPRIAESPSGTVWDTGWQNPGIDAFCDEELPSLVSSGTAVIVSVGPGSMEEAVRLAQSLSGQPIAAVEVNLSVPDIEFRREELGLNVDRAIEISGAVARMSRVPVFAKIPLHAANFTEIARAVVHAGIHGVTVGGPLPAMAVDATSRTAALGDTIGWLSGPALKPMTLRRVLETSLVLPDTPVLACGGIRSGQDAVEAMLAGAWGVQAGTATLVDPTAPVEMARDIAKYLKGEGFNEPSDIRRGMSLFASLGRAVEGRGAGSANEASQQGGSQ